MDNEVGGILYIKTPSGILKVLEIIFSLCAFICAMIAEFPWSSSMGSYFNIVTLMALIYALIIVILSVLNIAMQMGRKIDFITCICFSILIFSSASLFTPFAKINASYTAAVIFQYLNGFAFFGNTLHKVLQ